MLNPNVSHPEHFRELCALAAGGQISEPELVELQDHMRDCAYCRSTYAEFIDLLHNKLPLVDPELKGSSKLAGFFSESSSYRKRFLTRARRQGLAISTGNFPNTVGGQLGSWLLAGLRYTQVATLAIVLLLATVGILSYALHQTNARYRTLASDIAEMGRRISQQDRLGGGLARLSQFGGHSSPEMPPAPNVAAPSVTGRELVKARQDLAAAEARAQELREQLQATAFELQALRAQLDQAGDSRIQMANKLAETEQQIIRTNDELQRLKQSHSEDTATIAAKSLEIRELSEKLSAQTVMVGRDRKAAPGQPISRSPHP
jgi:hypothetical protein